MKLRQWLHEFILKDGVHSIEPLLCGKTYHEDYKRHIVREINETESKSTAWVASVHTGPNIYIAVIDKRLTN